MTLFRRSTSAPVEAQQRRRMTSAWGLIAVLGGLAGVGTASLAGDAVDLTVRTATLVLALAIAFAAAEILAVHLHFGRQAVSYSFSEIPLLLGIVLLPPFAVIAARGIGAVWSLGIKRRQPRQKLAFNLAHRWVETVVAITLWHHLLGDAPITGPRGWLVAATTVVAIEVMGSGLVALVIRLAEVNPPAHLFWRPMLAGMPAVAANSSVALLMITLVTFDWRAVWMVVVVVALLVVFQRAHGQVQQRHATLERVAAFGRLVAAELDTQAVVTVTLAELRTQLSAGMAGVLLNERLFPGMPALWDCDASIPAPTDAGVRNLRSVDDAMVIARHNHTLAEARLLGGVGVRDALIVPLGQGEESVGVLVVGERIGDATTFSSEDLQVCSALANNAAIALNNGRLASELRTQIRDNEHQALHDSLTGLANRRLFSRRLAEASGTVAVLLIDLDRFKEVNDTLGHHTGDQLLQMVATRVTDHVPDARCIARLGGDEFALGLDIEHPDEAVAAARRLRALLASSFALSDMSLSIDASIGVSTSAEGVTDPGVLLQHADVAMYMAKQSRTGVELYSPETDPSSHERLLLPGELRSAITQGELVVYYQPKVDLATEQVTGVEALVRWQHPRRGLVPPNEFIPLAEQAGLINALTQFVLERALTQCRAWRAAGHDLTVAVNVAPRTLHDEDFPEALAVLLALTGCPAEALTLEITEDDIMAEPARTIEVLKRLTVMGVTLAVDDLGTGYSSLAYLRRLPVHEVKIDRSFVMNMGSDDDDQAIVEAIVALSHRLGKRVVAEGVEDADAYDRLRAMGCGLAQGFWISRPMPADEVTAWLPLWDPDARRIGATTLISV